MSLRRRLAISVLLSWACATAMAEQVPTGASEFVFSGWQGSPIPVRLFVPAAAVAEAPVVIVMHGASRDAPRYFEDWSNAAAERGFIVAVPHFTADSFPGSARYNLGHVFDAHNGERRPDDRWTFAAIEPLFDEIVARTGSNRSGYTLFGHSAGSQFVHRFLYFVDDNRVTRAILANAGWYTMPDAGIDFPYGLRGSGIDDADLRRVLGSDVVVLLGDADSDANGYNMRKTPEAELQGPHRYARGQTFYRVAAARADVLDADFAWRIATVQGAAHSNAAMTPAAAGWVE